MTMGIKQFIKLDRLPLISILCLLELGLVLAIADPQTDARCSKQVTPNPETACAAIAFDEESAIHCNATSESACTERGCCWHKEACYRKPSTCYIDLRAENCRLLPFFQIYTGYSVNGTYCFVDTIKSVINDPAKFEDASSIHGVRILGPNDYDKSCVKYMNLTSKRIDGDPEKCTIRIWDHTTNTTEEGTTRANKCVIENKSVIMPFELGATKTCQCRLDCWKESEGDESLQSQAIQDYVKREQQKSSCAGILGRLVKKSWRNRVDILNSAEVSVVVKALLNTTSKVESFNVEVAQALLDTSRQLSKYKFYEGLENNSAESLIKSSTKFLSNIMKKVRVNSHGPHPAASVSKRSSGSEPRSNPVYTLEDETKNELHLKWDIMDNLEGIAENMASLIKLPQTLEKYVVETEEDAVSIQVAIAKPSNLNSLLDLTHSSKINSTSRPQNVRVKNFSNYDSTENVAIITAYYNVKDEELNENLSRVSGILAINPRTIKNDIVNGHISLPVIFTLTHGNGSCNGSCERLCSFADPNAEIYGTSWKQTECKMIESSATTTTCECNHTTHFAVLMQPVLNEDSTLTATDIKVLEYLSIILGSVSVAALSATMVVFIMYRRILLKDRMLIHVNMIIALLGGYISFLCGAVFSNGHLGVRNACFAFTIGSHLFFLATFFWYLMEGIYLFYKVVLVFSNKWAEWGTKYSPFIGWGCPIIAVSVALGVSRALDDVDDDLRGPDPYYDFEQCFLQKQNGMIWSFLAPALVIIAINTSVLIKVVVVIFQSSLSSAKKAKASEQGEITDSIKNSVKGAVILMPILGIPWIINVFVAVGGEFERISAYVHVVLTGLQGIAIFLFYCVFNAEVRNAYKLSAERRRSLASLEPLSKNRKRSHAPLIDMSKENSPETARHKNSITVSSTGRTLTDTSQLSSDPPSPKLSAGTLATVQEDKC